jgi:hypothetical protein
MYAEFTFCYTRAHNNLTSEWVEVIMACYILLYQHLLEGTEQCRMRPWVRLATFWIKNPIWAVLLIIELWYCFDTLGDCCFLCCVAGPSFYERIVVFLSNMQHIFGTWKIVMGNLNLVFNFNDSLNLEFLTQFFGNLKFCSRPVNII